MTDQVLINKKTWFHFSFDKIMNGPRGFRTTVMLVKSKQREYKNRSRKTTML